jgi:hypothetical protein
VEAKFCYNCGLVLGPTPLTQPSVSDPDGQVLKKLWVFSFIYAISVALGILSIVITYGVGLSALGVVPISFSIIATAVEIIGLISLVSALRTLSKIDSSFSIAATLSLFSLVGLPILIASTAFEASTLSGFEANPSDSSILSQFLLLSSLLGVVGIVALVGTIGIIIGLWRIGVRYGETNIKIWAVLFIIPYVSIVGALLTLSALRRMRKARESPEISSTPVL